MKHIDVFNGDADGICALIQLRLASPQQAMLITGVKRDISLLKQISSGKDTVITVLDISFEKNASDVERLLTDGASIDYTDHHKTGTISEHDQLTTHIDLSSDICTSLLINKRLDERYKEWALTAAFGDNLAQTATQLGLEYGLSQAELDTLHELGTLLNYNGYGESLDDLFFHPADLYNKLKCFPTPFEFINEDSETFLTLKSGYEQDIKLAEHAGLVHKSNIGTIVELPNEKWARRISGVFGNQLANKSPDKAHAVIQKRTDGENYLISIRAPLSRQEGADVLASQFPSGGGRKAAAGITQLPQSELSEFIKCFEQVFQNQSS